MKNILGIEADAKTIKGASEGVLTGILYLAPANVSGYEVCPKASEGCRAACLFTAGRGKMKSVTAARVAKTKRFFEERESFMADLVFSLNALEKKAAKRNMIPAARLNGTSDIAWEKIKCVRNGVEYRNVMAAFPKVEFYGYTKMNYKPSKLKNNHVTFSYSEENKATAIKALANGVNVAVVFDIKSSADLPKTFLGVPVVNGDASDVRFLDPKGVVVGLYLKGGLAEKSAARKSGFAIPVVNIA